MLGRSIHENTVWYSQTAFCNMGNIPNYQEKRKPPTSFLAQRMNCAHLLQLIIISSGMIRLFSMPILGWLPRPRKSPGGSILKLAILSLWLSITQKPYSFSNFSFSSLIFWKTAKKYSKSTQITVLHSYVLILSARTGQGRKKSKLL